MTSDVTLPFHDGLSIIVPDSLNLITSYVLREQLDWFEDEIGFVRRVLRSGDRTLDIGANLGCYTLSMAAAVGPGGRVWAYEPASITAKALRQSVAVNGFEQVEVVGAALSRISGVARLSLHDHSELNALIHGDAATSGATEEVQVTTLDAADAGFGADPIAFVKIDAEGEEDNILAGGARFFAGRSPLVMFEVRAGQVVNFGLVDRFADMGYQTFRLVPGLGLLVTFDGAATSDPFLLNLFACKPDRAAGLMQRGLLVAPDDSSCGLSQFDATRGRESVLESMARFPFARGHLQRWSARIAAVDALDQIVAIAAYLRSRDPSLPPDARFEALRQSFDDFGKLCEGARPGLALAGLARAAQDIGARSLAVAALGRLAQTFASGGVVDLEMPFLSPCARFDDIDPGPAFGEWLLSATLESLERLSAFSSFYSGPACLPRLRALHELGFASPEMRRRLALVQQRFGGG